MENQQSPKCINIVDNNFGKFALIQQEVVLSNHENIECRLELRDVYYPLLSLGDYSRELISNLLIGYHIKKITSLYPILNYKEDNIINLYSSDGNNETYDNYVRRIARIQIINDEQNKPILYKGICLQYSKFILVNKNVLQHNLVCDFDNREIELQQLNSEEIEQIIPCIEINEYEKLSILVTNELVGYSGILYVHDVQKLRTKNNSEYYRVHMRYASGRLVRSNSIYSLYVKNYGDSRFINIYYNYCFNCIVWNNINNNEAIGERDISVHNVPVFEAINNGIIKVGSLISGIITTKDVENYTIGSSTYITYKTPVLWDSIFYDYQSRDERLDSIFSLAGRIILPANEMDDDDSNSDYETYTKDDSFDDAFGGEDEAYWNID